MFATDSDLEAGLLAPSLRNRFAHERPDAAAIEHLERVVLEDLLFEIARDERGLGVIAAVAEGRLREVVRSETEELRVVGDLIGNRARARQCRCGTEPAHLYPR